MRSGAERLKELKVVLVDDSLIVQEYMNSALRGMSGCSLIGTANDGNEGLAMIRVLHPDVVLLDVSMPHKNGIEALRELRVENSKVIVIMFTADSSPSLRERCLQEGANYFVCKTEFRQLRDIFDELQKD
jgi:two-component system, CitB family, response regulator DctR